MILRTFFFLCLIPYYGLAQIFHMNGATVKVSDSSILYCNGGITLANNSNLINEGRLTTTLSSTLPSNGNMLILAGSTAQGNGLYRIQQNWLNDGVFIAGASTVSLYGNLEQILLSSNGTSTAFNTLILEGNGLGVNGKKTLSNTNASTSTNGQLILNDKELATNTNTFTVFNTNSSAILYDSTLNNEGFVSSIGPGYLIRYTLDSNSYTLPLGSSLQMRRFRPINLTPKGQGTQIFAGRLNNHSPANDGLSTSQLSESIDQVNEFFYHSLEQLLGSTPVDLGYYFKSPEDGNWSGIASWNSSYPMWEDLANISDVSAANFDVLQRLNWLFTPENKHYILSNTGSNITIPNVFTPNGDNVNDTYHITAKGATEYELVIVNRWGQVVFQTNDQLVGWNGNSNNLPCTDGVYFYKLNALINNSPITKQGFITLQR